MPQHANDHDTAARSPFADPPPSSGSHSVWNSLPLSNVPIAHCSLLIASASFCNYMYDIKFQFHISAQIPTRSFGCLLLMC